MFLRLIPAVIGSSVAAVGVVYGLLMLTGDVGSPTGERILTNATGFTLLGVLGFLVPLRVGLSIGTFDRMFFYVLPGFLVAARTTVIMGLTKSEELRVILLQALVIGGIGAVTAFVFWVLGVARPG